MVELQHGLAAIEAAGVTLVAISNDDVEALADFATAHEITYPLLADVDSVVIKRLGILNTFIPEEEAEFHGIPFPGAYVIDADGVVIDKFFENSLAFRPGPEMLLRSALGDPVRPSTASVLTGEADQVEIRAYLDGPNLAPGLVRDLVVEFTVPEGHHLYGEPVPEGMVATTVELDGFAGLITFDQRLPPTTAHQLATGEVLYIFSGIVEFRTPITISGGIGRAGDSVTVVVGGTARFQSCDDQACSLPQRSTFRVEIPIEPVIVGDLGRDTPRTLPMNGKHHWQQLLARRGERQDR